MLARSFHEASGTIAQQKQNSRKTIPLTLFLQGFFIGSIAIVLLSICLVLIRFVNETKGPVAQKLCQQQAGHVRTAMLREVHSALGVLEYLENRWLHAMAPTLHDSALRLFSSGESTLVQHNVLSTLYCASDFLLLVGAGSMTGVEPLGDDRAIITEFSGGLLHTSHVEKMDEVTTHHHLMMSQCQQVWLKNITVMENATVSYTPANPINEPSTMVITVYKSHDWGFVAVEKTPAGFQFPETTYEGSNFVVDTTTATVVVSETNITKEEARPESTGAVEQISNEGKFHFMTVSRISEESLHNELQRGSHLMVLCAVTIGVLIAAAGSLFVHVIIRPMVHLANDMSLVGKLEVAEVLERSSVFTEIDELTSLFSQVTNRVKTLRKLLPSDERSSSDDEGNMDLAAADATYGELQLQESMNVKSVRVHVSYESRSTSKEVGSADFDFVYAEGEADLFDRLCLECKEAVEEDEFQTVQMTFVSDTNEHSILRSSLYLQEILSTAPKKMRLVMQKSSTPLVGAFFTGLADTFNALATIAFVGSLLHSGEESNATIPFICIYFFTLGMNFMLAIVLLRSGNERFLKWASRSGAEVGITLILSTFSTQNIQIAFSNIKVGEHCLRFNAPEDDPLLQKSLSWSLFGFLFSDVAQLLFKIWILYNSPSVESVYVLALVSSGASVAFNLIFKMHAMLLWHNGQLSTSGDGSALSEEGHLVAKECTLVLCRFKEPSYVRQLSLRAVELNSFYSSVMSVARKYYGTPLTTHGGCVLLGFNLQARSTHHVNDALTFALDINKVLTQKGQTVCSAVSTGSYAVGMLGSLNSKVLHALGPVKALHIMSRTGLLLKQPVTASSDVLTCIGLDMNDFPPGTERKIRIQNPHAKDNVVSAVRPRQLFSAMPLLRNSQKMQLVVLLAPCGSSPCHDIAAGQTGVACGMSQLDRAEMEIKAQQIAANYQLWLEEQASALGLASGTYALPLSSDAILGH